MKVLCTRNIGTQEKNLPPLKEGHVYDVDDATAELMIKRGLAEAPPKDAEVEKAPVQVAAAVEPVTGSPPLQFKVPATPSPAAKAQAEMTLENFGKAESADKGKGEDYEGWSADDLHKEASGREIHGSSSMNKDELKKAIKADVKKKGK